MNIGDLSTYEATDEHVGRVAYDAGQPKDLLSLGVAPPAAADRTARHGFGQIRYRPARPLEHDPMPPHEGEGPTRRHAARHQLAKLGLGVAARRQLSQRNRGMPKAKVPSSESATNQGHLMGPGGRFAKR